MINYIEVSKACPVPFYAVGAEKDARYNHVHLHDEWFRHQLRWFHYNTDYEQKWQQNDQITIQLKSTLGPVEVDIINCKGQVVVENIPFTIKPHSVSAVDWTLYERTIDLSTIVPGDTALPAGVYYFYLSAGTIGNAIYALSEPFHVKASWPKTMLYEYSHNENDYDTIWETGIEYSFRCESVLEEYKFLRKHSSFENQVQSIKTNQSIPYNKSKLKVGGEGGVAPWVGEKMNFIMSCSTKAIDGLLMEPDEGAQIEPEFVQDYPLIYFAIDMREGNNLYSKRITAPGDAASSLMVVFDLSSWTWFGSIGGSAYSEAVRITKEV